MSFIETIEVHRSGGTLFVVKMEWMRQEPSKLERKRQEPIKMERMLHEQISVGRCRRTRKMNGPNQTDCGLKD